MILKFRFYLLLPLIVLQGCANTLQNHPDVVSARANGVPIFIYGKYVDTPNSAGGVGVKFRFQNLSEKTIKYVYFEVVPYNEVGDVAHSEIGRKSRAILEYTGPVNANEYVPTAYWENVWYNSQINCIELKSVKVEFINGDLRVFGEDELRRVSTKNTQMLIGDITESCDYKGE
ncbi:hypothetical protein [Marinobacter subterrani]|uniref:hypothetical protein n=1 Tax=Marinobacter subterrani TaxID=1658765 RepID=UPI0023549CD5|nr:hypothetical protein [Marinobacter subterrani]